MKLPRINQTNNSSFLQSGFKGINHVPGASNGEIYDMRNLTSDEYPLLCTRPNRWTIRSVAKPNGLFAAGAMFVVDGTTLYVDGVNKGTLTDSQKTFAALGERVVIFPDKKIYQNGILTDLSVSWNGASITFKDGTYAEEPAEANTIKVTGVNWSNIFKVGDGVTISGCTVHPENNKTPIIREISGDELRFYEGTFTLTGTSYTESGAMKIERVVPDLDYICVNDNRVWGCKDDTIWCSKLGDPTNWYVFDGVSTDAWSVESGSAGKFTGCVSFLGYPCFFKEEKIFKVYGNYPSNYQLMSSATLGVMEGSSRSMAIAGEVLYYLSRSGIVAYSGGIPSVISAPLGGTFTDAYGASDGLKYWVSLKRGANTELYCYDTQRRMWHREDNLAFTHSAYSNGLYVLTNDGVVGFGTSPVPLGTLESEFMSMAEFADYDWQTMDKKHAIRLKLRFEVADYVNIFMQYDGKPYELVRTITKTNKNAVIVSLPIKRCDHYRVKIEGKGFFRLYGLDTEFYYGGR